MRRGASIGRPSFSAISLAISRYRNPLVVNMTTRAADGAPILHSNIRGSRWLRGHVVGRGHVLAVADPLALDEDLYGAAVEPHLDLAPREANFSLSD